MVYFNDHCYGDYIICYIDNITQSVDYDNDKGGNHDIDEDIDIKTGGYDDIDNDFA